MSVPAKSPLILSMALAGGTSLTDTYRWTMHSRRNICCNWRHYHFQQSSLSSSQREAFSRSLPPLWLSAITVCPPPAECPLVAVTPVSWWIQVVCGWPQAHLHSCNGRSPSLALIQIRRIWSADTASGSLATWPKRPSLRLRTIDVTSCKPVQCRTSAMPPKNYWSIVPNTNR